MPAYAVDLLASELGTDLAGLRVLVLGVAYRGNVKETAFSGAFPLTAELRRRGATPVASDPLYSEQELTSLGFAPWRGEPVDAAIVQADHSAYATLTRADLPGVRAILDGREILDLESWKAAGIPARRIGHG
jgi:UDP-N-acetyl-D-mannosaminuronic acid dehydrogenase